MVVNAAGSAVDPRSGRLWADVEQAAAAPDADERAALAAAAASAAPSLATTIGVVMTDRALTGPQARKVAAVAHDGLARAIRPVHSMTDGDTIFCLASGRVPAPADPRAALAAFNALLDRGRGRVHRRVPRRPAERDAAAGPGPPTPTSSRPPAG